MERMLDIFVWINISGKGVLTTLTSYLGGWDMAMKMLVLVNVLDIITGVLSTLYHKKISSNIGYKGGIRKIGIYIMIAMAYGLDKFINTDIILRTFTIGYYIAVEGISLLENWSNMGLPTPALLKDSISQIKAKSEKGKR